MNHLTELTYGLTYGQALDASNVLDLHSSSDTDALAQELRAALINALRRIHDLEQQVSRLSGVAS